jgi:N-acetylneuraminate synthase
MQIANYRIGTEHPPFVIAEAGVHHYNSLELAKALILNARLAGVHAIKFQTYKAERIAALWAPTYWDSEPGKTQYDIFAERDKLTRDDYQSLIEYAHQVGIIFLSTPFDLDSASLLNDLGMPAFKIASADITFVPLLRHIASFDKPVLLSTGAATLDEIRQAVSILKPFNIPIALLHCSLSYPTALRDANLARIQALSRDFPDLVVGYSDHTQPQDSELACPLSITLGARIIEKHYTLNKALEGDDHYHAVDQEGLIRLVKNCREAFLMTNGYVEMTESEQAARTFARRSIVAAKKLLKGTTLSIKDVDFKRPGTGLSPAQLEMILGKTLVRDLDPDSLVTMDDLA